MILHLLFIIAISVYIHVLITACLSKSGKDFAVSDCTHLVLPSFSTLCDPNFSWGGVDACTFMNRISSAYDEVGQWRRNTFLMPSGNVGRSFVDEFANLFRSYSEASALESVSLKASTVLCALLLQKPSRSSKARDHVKCLQ